MLIMGAIRMYSRYYYLVGRWVFDDYVFLLSLSAGISLVALQIVLVYGVTGYEIWDVQLRQMTKPALMQILVVGVPSPFLIWLIKLAVYSLIFYVFRPEVYMRWLVYTGVGLSFCFYLAAVIVSGVACGPHGGSDRQSYLAGMGRKECGTSSGLLQIFNIVSRVVNIANDFYLLLIPIPAILKLNLPGRRKFEVLVIFLAGFGACIMSILGLIYRLRLCRRDRSGNWRRDATYVQNVFVVTTVEYTVGVIIPCMAPLAHIWKRVSISVKSYLDTKSFYRTSSLEGEYQLDALEKKETTKRQAKVTDRHH